MAGLSDVAAPPPAAQQPVRSTPEPLPQVQGSTGLEDDAEMREIFIDEAREVLQGARQGLQRLVHAPDDLGDLTLIRRAFHTLKGSARMVGLNEFGEAAWACEQLYNARLADSSHLEQDLQHFTHDAFADLHDWVEAIAAGQGQPAGAATLSARADALRHGAAAETSDGPVEAPAAAGELLERLPHLPSAADLSFDFDLALDAAAEPATAADAPPAAEVPTLPADEGLDAAFALDLGDEAVTAAAAAPPEPILLDLGSSLDDSVEELELDPTLDWADSGTDVELTAAQFDAAFGNAAQDTPTEPADAALDADASVEFSDTHIDPPAQPLEHGPAADDAGITAPVHLDLSDTADSATDETQAMEDEQVKVIGDLRIGIPLFNIYLNEADELSRRLSTELSEWAMEPEQPLGESTAALAHSLAGSSATVGYAELSALARSLEHALMRSIAIGQATPGEPQLFNDAAEEIRRLLHQFAAGFLNRVSPPLMKRLEQHELDLAAAASSAEATAPGEPQEALDSAPEQATDTAPAATAESASPSTDLHPPAVLEPGLAEAADPAEPATPLLSEELGQPALTAFSELAQPALPKPRSRHDALDDEDDIDAVDLVDEELFPIFREEGEELLPQLQSRMRDWAKRPSELSAAAACMRTLHTFKGGARLAGAMRLGEMAHRLETAIEHLLARGQAGAADVEALVARVDAISTSFDC